MIYCPKCKSEPTLIRKVSSTIEYVQDDSGNLIKTNSDDYEVIFFKCKECDTKWVVKDNLNSTIKVVEVNKLYIKDWSDSSLSLGRELTKDEIYERLV